ncbi:hypothetical protein FQN54_005540 [Arachnomyces sp. PD_36]|nr:hypothetical protein FQN54_005540 [Arachnomyces sp. PD_36]
MATESELKQQGAVEAAQNSNNVSAEAAEKVLIDEAKKAGGEAFQFDPNASAEEKAAQAKAEIAPNFHREKKSQGVAVPTDMTNGSAGNLERKSSEMEEAPVEKKNINADLTDEERWAADRTGWAPRFEHQKTQEEDDEPTLLDHQTWIEGKLDEKFFGDWYHNTGVIIFACLASWLIALLGGGLGWVFLVMAACGTYYRTSIRRVRRNFRDDVNREMSKNRLETDTESLEWINSFLVKFWPIYAPVLCDSIINSVDQVLSTTTPAFLDNLRMKTFVLGTKPPRLEHVKTYPKTEVDTVLMDWKFSFTPNDTMDLTARQLKDKVNPKVVLEVRVGKGVMSKGLDVIVEDFAFSGLMRVKVKLQLPFPHIERVDVCFLERPEIDYVCKPLGGDLLGFDINFIPGLESFIKEQIHGNLEPMMYDPNVFPVEIAKMLAGNPMDQAIGVLAVTIHGAHHLKNTDRFGGSPDPYAVVSLNSRAPLGQTKTVHDTADPRWNETIYVIITSLTDALTLQIYDWNEFRKDKELGVATFALDQLEQEHDHENLTLEVMSSGRGRGAVQADVRFFPVLGETTLEGGEVEPPPELNTGIAKLTVEQAKDLDGSKSLVGALNPYAIFLLNGKEVHTTKMLKRTNKPIFSDGSKEVLITDRKAARLGLVIKDSRDLGTDPVVGSYQMKLNDMLKMKEKGQEWFNLSGAQTGRAKISLDWKPVALRGVAGGAGYVAPIGVMRLHIKNAENLRNLETMGKSDPYLRVLLNGIEQARTVTFQNNLNPDWDEVIYVPIRSEREKVSLQVLDEESLGKDRPLGLIELNAANYIREGENGEYEVDDEKQERSDGLRLHGKGSPKGTLNYTVAFYPTLNVADPEEEEEEERAKKAMEDGIAEEQARKSLDSNAARISRTSTELSKTNGRASLESTSTKRQTNGDVDGEEASRSPSEDGPPKVHIAPEDLASYESGLIVFKLIEGKLAHSDVQLEVLMDDHVFPAYTSPKIKSKHAVFGDIGDAFVRELDASKITLRLVEKTDTKGEEGSDHAIAKLTGPTLPTLKQCLYKPTELTLRSSDGLTSKVTVSLRYLPVKMKLDPSESINNMGTLRVDVLDAADLPSADRNGFSDPYCKFKLDGKEVFKTKVQKKTLHPAWNEFFECPIKSRIAADFKLTVYDWDFGDKADLLGGASIDLAALEPFRGTEVSIPLDGNSGAVRLKLLFKSDYVMRSRQGSSTFSGTFAAPGKIVGAPVKGVGMVGGGVVKGASFLKHGLMKIRGGDKDSDEASVHSSEAHAPAGDDSPQRATVLVDGATPPASTPPTPPAHHRSRSMASQIGEKIRPGASNGTNGKGDSGTALITVLSAVGYAPGTNVRVHVKQVTSKGAKEVHKTKAIKASASGGEGGGVQFDQSHETFKLSSITADTNFQVQVRDHSTFGSDETLGEALFFIDDQGTSSGKEKSVKVGSGTVTLRTGFLQAENASLRPGTAVSTQNGDEGVPDSPDSRKSSAPRRSFLAKRSPSGPG